MSAERHRYRRHMNRKYKHRDKNSGKPWNRHPNWIMRHNDKKWAFNRRKAPTEMGYGVAYERNPDANKL